MPRRRGQQGERGREHRLPSWSRPWTLLTCPGRSVRPWPGEEKGRNVSWCFFFVKRKSRPTVWEHKKACLSLRPYLEQIPVLGGNDGVDASAEDLHPVLLDGARLPHLNAAVLRSQQQHRGERRWKMTKGSDRKSCCQRTKGREKPWKRSERQRKDSALTSAVCPPIERMMPSGFSFMISSSTCCGVTGMKYTASASPGHVKLARTLP